MIALCLISGVIGALLTFNYITTFYWLVEKDIDG